MATALIVLIVAAAIAAPSPLRAIVGDAGRHSGTAVWTAGIVLAIAAAAHARQDRGAAVSAATVAASVPITAYALIQAIGRDPFTWSAVEGGPQVFATFGNADYLSAWLAMAIPLATAVALGETWSATWRLLGAATALLGFAAAVASGSLQGPVGGLAGAMVVFASWGTEEGWSRRSRRRAALVAVALVICVMAAAGLAAPRGPASVLASAGRSIETRVPAWIAAWRMAASSPVLGIGPGHFSDKWFQARPEDAIPVPGDAPPPMRDPPSASQMPEQVITAAAPERPVDDAHAVWLHVAATAGWPAALLWIVLMAGTVLRAAHGLQQQPTPDGTRVAGLLGAAMAAITVLSVSVDVPPVTVTAWVIIGTLYGAVTADDQAAASDEQPPRSPSRSRVMAVIGLAGAGWLLAAVPLAADLVAGSAGPVKITNPDQGEVGSKAGRLQLAADVALWERRYPARLAVMRAARGQFDEALEAQQEALRRAPQDRSAALDVARLMAAVEGPTAAMPAYEAVLAIDSRTPAVLMEAGMNALAADRPRAAVRMMQRAVEVAPDQRGWASVLREAEAAARSSTGV